ncbi:cell division protein FtsK [Streptomyces harbinensis]|uniref:cell division protein FtsK n=1 Tax=Streptomyces harbinensis TaxID=1176198 RepID=UPI00371AA355
MDKNGSWSKNPHDGKTDRSKFAAGVDALSPLFASFAARWDAEAKRRNDLRTPENLKALGAAQRENNSARSQAIQARAQRRAAKAASKNPWSTSRRAARTADKAARAQASAARAALKAARKSYPDTLARVAVRVHLAHSVPAAVASYALSTPEDWTVWPVSTSVAAITGHWAALWLGRRTAVEPVAVAEDASAEERRLMERLDPSYWAQHAAARGLKDTISTPPQITAAGIECDIRLDEQWTPKKLRAAADNIRALLGARTDLPMLVVPGTSGGWAVLRLRTRSAAPDGVIPWTPAGPWGIDMVTGEEVRIGLGHRMLLAGMSGAGKSTASRPLLHDASEGPAAVLVIIDLKQVEGRLWDHRARVASTPADVVALVEELTDELTERLAVLPKGQATLVPSAQRPRITVVVDEGAEVISSCRKVETVVGWTEKGAPITEKQDALEGLDTLARMGRAACMDLWWMTQSPTYGDGVPRQIAKQLGVRIGLTVDSPSEARVVFGESAQDKGWKADELPMPGVAMVRGTGRTPDPVKVTYMSDDQVIALPEQPIWTRRTAAEAAPARPALKLVKQQDANEEAAVPAARPAERPAAPEPTTPASAPAPAPGTNRARVLQAVTDGATSAKAVADATGINKGTVSREIKSLVTAGQIDRADDGTLTIPGTTTAKEATA